MTGTPALSRGTVDRNAFLREDEAALRRAWDSGHVLVLDDQGRCLVDGTDLVLLPGAEAPAGDRLYLGTDGEQHFFAVRGELPRRLGAQAKVLRDIGHLLGDRDAGLLVHAVGLANWHSGHPCCARCGAPTEAVRGDRSAGASRTEASTSRAPTRP